MYLDEVTCRSNIYCLDGEIVSNRALEYLVIHFPSSINSIFSIFLSNQRFHFCNPYGTKLYAIVDPAVHRFSRTPLLFHRHHDVGNTPGRKLKPPSSLIDYAEKNSSHGTTE